jgi:hypothetical protein
MSTWHRLLLLFPGLIWPAAGRAETPAPAWLPATWNGEKALASTAHGWKAVVSLERGRLIHFGPADRDLNLLRAPPTRENPAQLGGHRLWLGPQRTWSSVWPPPPAWESNPPESFVLAGGGLRLVMADAGDGWPRLTRTYRWDGARLVCGVEMIGGTRPAQFMQIFQLPAATEVEVGLLPETAAPRGYVLLPSGQTPQFTAAFPAPAAATVDGSRLTLRYRPDLILKTGHRPQPLTARYQGFVLRVSRGPSSGTVAAAPDEGFFSQVYLGGPEPFVELEQLSPLYAPGAPASFATVLEAAAPPAADAK